MKHLLSVFADCFPVEGLTDRSIDRDLKSLLQSQVQIQQHKGILADQFDGAVARFQIEAICCLNHKTFQFDLLSLQILPVFLFIMLESFGVDSGKRLKRCALKIGWNGIRGVLLGLVQGRTHGIGDFLQTVEIGP